MKPRRKYIGMFVQGNWLVLIYCIIVLLIFCYLLSTAYFMCCLFCFCFLFHFYFFIFLRWRKYSLFNILSIFLWLSVDPRIFAKHLFVFPYEINSSLLIATTKREHLFWKKVEVEFNASEETHWNVCARKLVMPITVVLIYNFIVLLIFCYLLSTVYFTCSVLIRFFCSLLNLSVCLSSCAIFKTDII